MNPVYTLPVSSQMQLNIGALIIRIGFWVPLYYNHNQEPPICNSIGEIIKAPILDPAHLSPNAVKAPSSGIPLHRELGEQEDPGHVGCVLEPAPLASLHV